VVGSSIAAISGRAADQQTADDAARGLVAFYGSTPAYRPVLEVHGWGDLQTELNALSKQGEWVTMGDLIDDEMLAAFAVIAEPEQLGAELHARYGDIVDRLSFYAPYKSDPERWRSVLASMKG